MKILLLSRYDSLGASSRVRLLQYLPFLRSMGWQVDVTPLFSNSYLHAFYSRQPRWRQVVAGYWRRIQALVKTKKYDLLWIEKETLPFLPALVERLLTNTNVPYIVDYDDAWFHRYDRHPFRLVRWILGKKIDSVMRHAALVIAGNEYLASRARSAGARSVEIIPTVVDLNRYNIIQQGGNHPLIVGWVGSPATSHYLVPLGSVFKLLMKKHDVRIVAVGANAAVKQNSPIEILPWMEKTEVELIQSFDIGIMPLVDSLWERGKCGYKLIQYMACGLPVVASPVGVNTKIVKHGVNGFLARDFHEWNWSLQCLLNHEKLRRSMGVRGRERVEKCFSLQVQASRLERLIYGLLK